MIDDKKTEGRKPRQNTSADLMNFEIKQRLAMRRKLLQSDEAQILTETVRKDRPGARLAGRLVMDISLLLAILLLGGLIGGYAFVLPRFIRDLPSMVNHPQQEFSTYKRVVKATIEYVPHVLPVATSTQDLAPRPYEHGAVFTMLSSSDVVSQQGAEGAVRVGIDKQDPFVSSPDIDILYKTFWGQNAQTFITYLLFNQWPQELSILKIPDADRIQWFLYTPNKVMPYGDFVNSSISLLWNGHDDERDKIMAALWNNAVETKYVRWQMGKIFRRDPRLGWVSDIYVAVDPSKAALYLASLKVDQVYGVHFRGVIKQGLNGTSWPTILGWIRSLSGTVSVGLFDRLIYETKWDIDIDNDQLGTFTGVIETTIDKLPPKDSIAKPVRAGNIQTLVPLAKPQPTR